MVLTTGYDNENRWVYLSIIWTSKQLKNTTFWKLDLLLSPCKGRETPE
jgi:hypothetical protein